jgi:hypothetical protein
MGCGCANKAKQEYEVTTKDGKTVTVKSRTEALALVRKEGGTWKQKAA